MTENHPQVTFRIGGAWKAKVEELALVTSQKVELERERDAFAARNQLLESALCRAEEAARRVASALKLKSEGHVELEQQATELNAAIGAGQSNHAHLLRSLTAMECARCGGSRLFVAVCSSHSWVVGWSWSLV